MQVHIQNHGIVHRNLPCLVRCPIRGRYAVPENNARSEGATDQNLKDEGHFVQTRKKERNNPKSCLILSMEMTAVVSPPSEGLVMEHQCSGITLHGDQLAPSTQHLPGNPAHALGSSALSSLACLKASQGSPDMSLPAPQEKEAFPFPIGGPVPAG